MIMNFKASKQGTEDGSEEYRIEIKFQLATTDSIEVNIYWKNILPNRRYCDAFAKKIILKCHYKYHSICDC